MNQYLQNIGVGLAKKLIDFGVAKLTGSHSTFPEQRIEQIDKTLETLKSAPVDAQLPATPPTTAPESHKAKTLGPKTDTNPKKPPPELVPLPTDPQTEGVSREQVIAYQNRELGKLLYQMERHYAQKLRIAGIPCDCLVKNEEIYAQSATCAINKPTNTVLTHKGQIKSVTRRTKRRYHGELREIKVRYTNIPLLVTPGHPILGIYDARKANWRCNGGGLDHIAPRWITAGEITPRSFIAFPRLNQTQDIPLITPDFAELLGWYVAEGSKGGNRITLSLGKEETSNAKLVSDLMIACLGKKSINRETETTIQLDYCSKAFTPIFAEFGSTALKKQIPGWFLHLPFVKQFRFLKGYTGGDGYRESNRHYSIGVNTVSPRLAYGLRLLLYRLGILHGLYKRPQRDGLINGRAIHGNGTRYEIQIGGEAASLLANAIGEPFNPRERALRNMGWVSPNYVFAPIVSNEAVLYNGIVYNISVEDDESYLTVHGAVHNCGSSKHLLGMEALSEETIPMVENPQIYYRIIEWVKKVGPKSTDEAAKSGLFDEEYPIFSHEARDFRKEIIGSLDPKALFPQKPGEPEGTRILPVVSEEEREQIRQKAHQKIEDALGEQAQEV